MLSSLGCSVSVLRRAGSACGLRKGFGGVGRPEPNVPCRLVEDGYVPSGFYRFSTESDTGVLDKSEPEIGYGYVWKSHPEWGPSMSLRRLLSLVLVLVITSVLSACASSTNTPFGEGGETALRAAGGSSTLIVRAQLDRFTGRSAWEAVETVKPRWLQIQRGTSIVFGPAYARVMIDGVARGELDELHRLSAENIETMRYLSAPDATTRYGTGFPGGVIEVTTTAR